MRYMVVVTKEGRGLTLCIHEGAWYLGLSRCDSKGRRTKWVKTADLDEALLRAVRLCRVWRGKSFGLASQFCK